MKISHMHFICIFVMNLIILMSILKTGCSLNNKKLFQLAAALFVHSHCSICSPHKNDTISFAIFNDTY